MTDADRAVERALRDRISVSRPGEGVFAEEEGDDGGAVRWVIDPIDGTKNFSRGAAVWATLIALEREGEVVRPRHPARPPTRGRPRQRTSLHPLPGRQRLRLRNPAGHTARPTKRRPHRPRPRGHTHPPRPTRRPPLRFHDLRHTFASHLIVDLRLDVCQVSRILGHARTAITLDVYTHLFERARHAAEIRAAMADSRVAHVLAEATAAEPWRTENAGTRARAPRSQPTIVRRRIRCHACERSRA